MVEDLHPDYMKANRKSLVRLAAELRTILHVLCPEEVRELHPMHGRVQRITALFNQAIADHVDLGPDFDIRTMTDDRKNDLLWKVWMIASGQE